MKSIRIAAAGLALLTGLWLPAPQAAEPSSIEIDGAWVRSAPPTMDMTAGYLSLTNSGSVPRRLVAVSSPDYANVMMHRTVVHDGIARMEMLSELEIPANSTREFTPGGNHLMLMGATRELAPGTDVTLQLEFGDGETLTVRAPVR